MSESMTTRVADRLREMIVLDEFRSGENLRERVLCETLDVSRTPLREALKLLEAEGLVVISRNRGARVADLSEVDIAEKLKVLAALERLAGELACAAASDTEIAEICALHYEMCAAFARGDRKAYFRANQAIHLGIVAASGNKALIETHSRFNNQLFRARYLSNLENELWPSALKEHEAIKTALEARKGAELGQLLFDHLGSTWNKFAGVKDDPRVVAAQDAAPAKRHGDSGQGG